MILLGLITIPIYCVYCGKFKFICSAFCSQFAAPHLTRYIYSQLLLASSRRNT
uniref:Uncharacterized protein n=1 Tax=Arundo donax TaxID=35708 RepID=A0A0A9FJY9_ARUDO